MKTRTFTSITLTVLLFSCCHDKINDLQFQDSIRFKLLVSDTMGRALYENYKLNTCFRSYDFKEGIGLNKRIQYEREEFSRSIPVIHCNWKKLRLSVDTSSIVPFTINIKDTTYKAVVVLPADEYYKTFVAVPFEGYLLSIKNTSIINRSTVCFGDGFGIIQEAKDMDGIWKPIQFDAYVLGHPSGYRINLYPHNTLILAIPKYYGTFNTTLRVKLKGNCDTIFSNEFYGSISRGQFIPPDTSSFISDLKLWF